MAADFITPASQPESVADALTAIPEISSGLSRIKLRHLQCLVAIAAHRHMGRAAESLRIAQPAISKTLTELESLVGAALVARFQRGATLTLVLGRLAEPAEMQGLSCVLIGQEILEHAWL